MALGNEHQSPKSLSYTVVLWAAAVSLNLVSLSQAIAQDDQPPFEDVTNSSLIKTAIGVLNGYLVPLSPAVAVTRCEMLIGTHRGEVEDIFVGVCELKSAARVMVCGDTGIGEFGLTPWHGGVTKVTRSVLLRFAEANCPGG